jgi:hypothetical protein
MEPICKLNRRLPCNSIDCISKLLNFGKLPEDEAALKCA